MENRLKERLTGAVIVVALIVVLVPQMFRGQHGQGASAPSSGGEGPPLRTYTIDLSNTAARKAPLQSAPDAAAAPTTDVANVNANASAASALRSAGSTASSAAPVTAPPPAASPASPSVADEPVEKPKPTSSAHTPTPPPAHAEPAAHVEAAAAPTHAGHTAESNGWSVQLGLFVKRENAERLMHAAQDKGFAVSVSAADGKRQFRVHVTGMADRNAAQAVAARLKADGFAAGVVGPQ